MTIVRLAFFALLCAASAFAADLTGTWTATFTIPAAAGRGGRGPAGPVPFIVHIKQTGDMITGYMDGIGGNAVVPFENAKVVDANTISYEALRGNARFNYTATLDGEKLNFKILRADGTEQLITTTATRLTPVY
jgi:hypothetical protein